MISKEVLDFINENELSKTFIDDAAKKAKAINCATHPYSFSHPQPFTASDKKVLSHIVFQGRRTEDGYVRSGNVKVSRPLDLSGNAGDAKIWKFLMLKLSNGFTILENLRDRTPEAYELLQMDGRSKDDAIKLMDDFSLMFEQSDSQVTSSRIKQVYFHIGENQYHLLSVVTPSCLVFELKNRICELMKKLSQREQDLIEAKYFYDKKLKDISAEFNISQSRISRIIQNALDKIKKELLKQEALENENNI